MSQLAAMSKGRWYGTRKSESTGKPLHEQVLFWWDMNYPNNEIIGFNVPYGFVLGVDATPKGEG